MKVKIGKLKDQDSNYWLPLAPLYNNIYNMTKLALKYKHTFTNGKLMEVTSLLLVVFHTLCHWWCIAHVFLLQF